ncbi:MAG: SlyX family protein [Hyphomicrobiales bacterium]|nr:MAG: SlyX family protein [Hyphomicrobiales bacterium]
MSDTDRIIALEERIAYQDQTIEDLNATILELWKEIDGLKRQLGKLGDELSTIAADVPQAAEPPPPHY